MPNSNNLKIGKRPYLQKILHVGIVVTFADTADTIHSSKFRTFCKAYKGGAGNLASTAILSVSLKIAR